nr:zinc finger, CCHC-type [Tanacetum cinerariifolium]
MLDMVFTLVNRSYLFRTSNQVVGVESYKWYQSQVIDNKRFGVQVLFGRQTAAGYRHVKVLEFFDCLGPRQGVEDLRERFTQQCMKSGVAKHLGVTVIQQQNELVDETNVTLFSKALHGFEFEVELLGDHTARDKEQHLACELFGYIEDSNETAFSVAAVEKIYAHESLTFNNTVACEVIFKYKARLKDDMDARSDVYVLSNGCRKCSDDSDDYYREYIP